MAARPDRVSRVRPGPKTPLKMSHQQITLYALGVLKTSRRHSERPNIPWILAFRAVAAACGAKDRTS